MPPGGGGGGSSSDELRIRRAESKLIENDGGPPQKPDLTDKAGLDLPGRHRHTQTIR